MKRAGLLLAVAALVATAGCVGFVTGSGPLDMNADPAAVPQDALNDTGYQEMGAQSQTLNRTVSVAGQERRVNAEVHVATYARVPENAASGSPTNATTLTLVSAPAVEVAGQEVNPLQSAPDSVVFGLLEQSGAQLDVEKTGTGSVTMLDEETTATTYRTNGSGGSGQSVVIERASVVHESDLVLALVTYPENGSGESAHRLLPEIDHPVNASR